MPADAAVYGEATIDPQGDQENAVRSIVARFPGTGEPEERLTRLIDQAVRDVDSEVSWSKDIEPWLGDTIAGFALDFTAGGVGAGALLLETSDEDKAQDFIEKVIDRGADERSAEGLDYKMDGDTAVGIVDGWLVLGSESGFKAAARASKGGAKERLGSSDRFAQAMEGAAEDRLGLVYVELGALAKLLGEELGSVASICRGSLVLTLGAKADAVTVESVAPSDNPMFTTFAVGQGEGTDLIEDAAADSWLALGHPDLGKTVDGFIDLLSAELGGRKKVEQMLKDETGLELERDLLSWMGDAALWVRGTNEKTIDGAALVESSAPAATMHAVRTLQRLAATEGEAHIEPIDRNGARGFTASGPEVPKPLHFALAGERFIFAYGDEALEQAARESDRLGDATAFKDARAALGDGFPVASYFDVEPILELAESFGAASDDGYLQAKPYLEPLDFLVSGARKSGDQIRSRIVFGFR